MSTTPNRIMMTVSVDQDDNQSTPSNETNTMMNDVSSDSNSSSSDAPITPPSAGKKNTLLSSSEHGAPPQLSRHGRPINRRLLLQEAQERLSLPDLFAPRTVNPSRRARHPRMSLDRVQRPSSSRSLLTTTNIYPRAVQWGEYFDGQGHSMSQRSVYDNPAML